MRKVFLWTLSLGEQQGTPTTVLKHEVVWMLVFVVPQEKWSVTPSQYWLRRSTHQKCRDRFGCTVLPNSHCSSIDAPSYYLLFGLLKKSCEDALRPVTRHWKTLRAAGCRGGTGTFTGQEYVLLFIDGRCRQIRGRHWNITLPLAMLQWSFMTFSRSHL